MFERILNAGGTKYIQYILDTNHAQQLEDAEDAAVEYWRFVKNQLEASTARTKSVRAVGELVCREASVDVVRLVLLAGSVCGSGDMVTLAEHLEALYAASCGSSKPRHLRILLDDCTPSRGTTTPAAANCLVPVSLKTKGVSISNMNRRTFGEATSRALFFDILKLLHGYMVECKLHEVLNQSTSWLFALSFKTSDVKAMLRAVRHICRVPASGSLMLKSLQTVSQHKEAIEYVPRFAFCHLQFILCDLSTPGDLKDIADNLLTSYVQSCALWASEIPTVDPLYFLRLRQRSGVTFLEMFFDPVDKVVVVLRTVQDHQATAREVHPVPAIRRE
ncbi:hypothetical protein QFC20_001598 [Naganishia adeliensis]|uniref:Uncharacterized protein n=1 Tax=Naganishia adeliensis TaxID=92952 RepID=A0ACC2WTG4_9TREE|nr:hypothetical protein QFC20_001598 [Naganishia adeliensis]